MHIRYMMLRFNLYDLSNIFSLLLKDNNISWFLYCLVTISNNSDDKMKQKIMYFPSMLDMRTYKIKETILVTADVLY